MKPSRSEFHTLRQRRYHIRFWGEDDAPLLVMLHGWGDVSASWQFVVDALRRNWKIAAPDWRGFGLSAWDNTAYWYPDYLADLEALLDLLSPDAPTRIVGHSMGGNIASLYAGVRPERVAGLVNLEGIGLPRRESDEAPGRLVQWLDQLKQTPSFRAYPSYNTFAARLAKENPRLSPEKAAFLAHSLGQDDGAGGIRPAADPCHRWVNPTLYRIEEAMACWRKVTAPMLWVAGADSELAKTFFAANLEDLKARLACFSHRQDATLYECGHNIHHDQPERLAQLIEDFFSP
jgi:pimeloyl-ACP methyl ester carboxylesterase